MPHIIVELSQTLRVDESVLLSKLGQALYDSGEFKLSDIKSRLYQPSHSMVGVAEGGQDFVYVRLLLMKGRSDATKQALAQAILTVLKQQITSADVQYGVEVVELSSCYLKA